MIDWITALVLPLLTSGLGWFRNAYDDGELEWFEWQKFISTSLLIILPVLALHWGLGWDQAAVSAIVSVVVLVTNEIRNIIKKSKA